MVQTPRLQLEINEADRCTFGPCECCGNMTQRVWGYVYENNTPLATYFVEWTPGHKEQGASFDLIVGRWGDESSAADRVAIALNYRCLDTGPALMVVNASGRAVARSPLVGTALARDQVIGTQEAQTAFSICDVVLVQDPRVASLGC